MNEDFTFEQAPFEAALLSVRPGSAFSAARLLALLEGESEPEVEAAFALAEELDLSLTMDLPPDDAPTERQVRAGTLRQSLGENDPLRLYLNEIGERPLSPQAAQSLAEKSLSGDQRAMEALAQGYLPRAAELAMTMTGRGVLLLDLIQEGSLALWQGLLAYEGGDFSAFADRRVRFALVKAIALQARAQGVGRELKKSLERYQAADRDLLGRLGRNPLREELAQALGWNLEETERVEKLLSDARAAQKAPREPENEPQPVEHTAYFQSRQRVAELLTALPEEDARLLTLRFGLEGGKPATVEQAAQALGIPAEEVLRREAAALLRLREET